MAPHVITFVRNVKKQVVSAENLTIHMETHKGDKRLQCINCEAEFKKKVSLDAHILDKHSTVRDAVCKVCGKSFGHARTLSNHMRCHR